MARTITWKARLIQAILILWGLQCLYLAWHFAPEVQEMAWRISRLDVGRQIRQEDPLYRWTAALAAIIPPDATYVFLDDYEAGKEIQARYFLAPRRHILLSPQAPASFLFYTLHQEKASFLLIRDREQPLGPGAQAAIKSPALRPVPLPGPGLAYRVDAKQLSWGFYD
jgi:hypothetical protein